LTAKRLAGTSRPCTDVGVTLTTLPLTATVPLAVTSTPSIFWWTVTWPGLNRRSTPAAWASDGPSRVATIFPDPTESRWTLPWNRSVRLTLTAATWIDSCRISTGSTRRSSRLTSTSGTEPDTSSRPTNGNEWIEADDPAPGG